MPALNEEIKKFIRKHFPEIIDRALSDEIARFGKLMHFREGEVIMDYGTYVKLVPLVLKGSIKVLRQDDTGNEIFLYFLCEGETCASSFTCCMIDKKSFIKTVAEEDTTIIAIPVHYAAEWTAKYPNWKNFVMQAYDNRIMELIRTIDSIAFLKMDERLLKYLTEKVKATNTNLIQATHQEIAYDLNASREAISRLLKQLEQKGLIKLGRNKIELCH